MDHRKPAKGRITIPAGDSLRARLRLARQRQKKDAPNLADNGQDGVTSTNRLAKVLLRSGNDTAHLDCTDFKTNGILTIYDIMLHDEPVEGYARIDTFAAQPDDFIAFSPTKLEQDDNLWNFIDTALEYLKRPHIQ